MIQKLISHIKNKVKWAIEVVIHNIKFVSLTCDEVTSMDYASWASVHAYIMQDWCQCQISSLLNVQHVIYGFQIDVLTMVIMNFLMTKGALKEEKNTSRLVYFGDGINTFQGLRFRIVIQNQCQHVPFVNGMHYIVHQTKPCNTNLLTPTKLFI